MSITRPTEETLTELEEEQVKLHDQMIQVLTERGVDVNDQDSLHRADDATRAQVAPLANRFVQLNGKIEAIRDGLYGYHRPRGWMGAFVSRLLPPLPQGNRVIHPTDENFGRVGSYRLFASLLFVGAITTLIVLAFNVPWMLISPGSLIIMGAVALFGKLWGSIVGGIAITVLLVFSGGIVPRIQYRGRIVNKLAMQEEQWFRMGAEDWTFSQRFVSTALFGFFHILNVIYPLASLLVVGAVGGVFMAVYLRTFKKTGDRELATLAAAKLHATYNRFALAYLVIAVGLTAIYGIYTSFV